MMSSMASTLISTQEDSPSQPAITSFHPVSTSSTVFQTTSSSTIHQTSEGTSIPPVSTGSTAFQSTEVSSIQPLSTGPTVADTSYATFSTVVTDFSTTSIGTVMTSTYSGCCRKKKVGLMEYSLFSTTGDDWEMDDTGCTNTCIYQKEGGDPDLKFCFKPGFKNSECVVF